MRLGEGEVWQYDPPAGHDVAWVAVHEGQVSVPSSIAAGEMAVFAESRMSITFTLSEARSYSVPPGNIHTIHTHADALDRDETKIRQIGLDLRNAGRL